MRLIGFVATLALWSGTASAEDAITTTPEASVPANASLTKADRERRLVEDPDYHSARAMRTGGIVVLSVGLAAGVLVASFGALSGLTGGEQRAMPFLVAGGVSTVLGLGVGIPLWILGQVRINHVRARLAWSESPWVTASLGDRAGGLQATWRW